MERNGVRLFIVMVRAKKKANSRVITCFTLLVVIIQIGWLVGEGVVLDFITVSFFVLADKNKKALSFANTAPACIYSCHPCAQLNLIVLCGHRCCRRHRRRRPRRLLFHDLSLAHPVWTLKLMWVSRICMIMHASALSRGKRQRKRENKQNLYFTVMSLRVLFYLYHVPHIHNLKSHVAI